MPAYERVNNQKPKLSLIQIDVYIKSIIGLLRKSGISEQGLIRSVLPHLRINQLLKIRDLIDRILETKLEDRRQRTTH